MRLSIPIYTFKAFPDLICPLMLNQVYSKNKVTMYPELQLNNRIDLISLYTEKQTNN
jgi:hypothetical protein